MIINVSMPLSLTQKSKMYLPEGGGPWPEIKIKNKKILITGKDVQVTSQQIS